MKDLVNNLVDIKTEMMLCIQNNSYAKFSGLIEQWQTLGNRLEAILWDQTDVKSLRDDIKKLKKEIEKLEEKKEELS